MLAYVLRIQSSSGSTREVPLLEGETTIGRDPANTLVLSGRGVSRRHAKLLNKQDRITIVDLGSTYGTKVCGMPTLRREVRPGEQISIGMHELEIGRATSLTSRANQSGDSHSGGSHSGGSHSGGRHSGGRPAYYPDEVTHDPRTETPTAGDPRAEERVGAASIDLDSGSLQFIDDSTAAGQAEVVEGTRSQIMEAVERLGTGVYPAIDEARATIAPKTPDYHALLMMYKVSQLLGEAEDLDAFVSGVADLVMEEVRANTVVVLTGEVVGQDSSGLEPRAIRHRGALGEGEVPVSRSILDLVLQTGSAVLSGDALHDKRIRAGQSLALYNVRAVLAAPLTLRGRIRGVIYLNRDGPIPFSKAEGELVGALAALMASGMERAELKQHVHAERQRRRSLERFHPPEVIEKLTGDEGVDAEGDLDEHEATVLCCDILGFENLSVSVPPQQLAQILGDYYELLYEKVFGNAGSLVKLSDGWAMALFGMHGASTDAVWAVEAARQLVDEFEALTLLWPFSARLQLGCVVATGTVVAGAVGSAERLEYVALGAPVRQSRALLGAQRPGLLLTEGAWAKLPQRRFRAQAVEHLLADALAYQLL